MRFFDINQCKNERFCEMCRALHRGTEFRISMARIYDGIESIDFPCPKGKPWVQDTPPSAVDSYDNIKTIITSAPDEGEWKELKEELRIHESAMELHANTLSPCWMKRQKQRIVSFLNTAIERGLITQESIHAIMVQQGRQEMGKG